MFPAPENEPILLNLCGSPLPLAYPLNELFRICEAAGLPLADGVQLVSGGRVIGRIIGMSEFINCEQESL